MLPEPLFVGLAIAGGLAVVFAGVFVAGERLFPATHRASSDDTGEWKRRREIRDYLDAIGEHYAEDHFVAGQHVAFYLPERDVAITFDAQAYFRMAAGDTYPILAEHEMPGAHLGARLPFETPDVGRGAATGRRAGSGEPTPDTVAGAFDVLGLAPDATREEVRRAYRAKVKEVHPDQGGDEETFRRVREAYTAARRRAS